MTFRNTTEQMKTCVRKAGPPDLHFVQQCAQLAYQPYVSRIGRKPAPMVANFQMLIADGKVDILTVDGRQAGYAVWYFKPGILFLENIALHPDFHGKGLSSLLFSFLEEQARANGKTAIELYTNEKMTENLDLYPHLGFEEVARYEEDGFSRVFFRKPVHCGKSIASTDHSV